MIGILAGAFRVATRTDTRNPDVKLSDHEQLRRRNARRDALREELMQQLQRRGGNW